MEVKTPAWVKHFEENFQLGTVKHDLQHSKDESFSSLQSPDQTRSIHKSQSYTTPNPDRKLSAGQILPRVHTTQSDFSCPPSEDEKKVKKRRRRPQVDETSGYSTTSLSEVSEVDTPRKRRERRHNENYVSPNRRHENLSDDRSERSRISRCSQATATSRRPSEASLVSDCRKVEGARRMSESSRKVSDNSRVSTNTKLDCDKNLVRNSRIRSTTDSVTSVQSKNSHTNQRRPSTSSRLDIQSLGGNRKLYGSRDNLDPFAFIQPVPEPFSRKLRKTLKPVFGMCLMLILAASLGAAIYFAVELKKTQENEIEMLRANLALKIKSSTFGKDLEDLSPKDFKDISGTYCQQMDKFYGKSQFESSYRGCEVISIKNARINFTLFFVEKDASKKDIIAVIKTSAPKVNDNNTNTDVALVDKFEIELDEVKIKIEHKRTPVGFNKIIEKPKQTTFRTSTTTSTTSKTTSATTLMSTSKVRSSTRKEIITQTTSATNTTTPTTTVTETTTAKDTTTATTKKSMKVTVTKEMLLAWDPCSLKDGRFFPHPKECNKYFMCTHGRSILQICTGDLLFDIESNVCVPDKPGLVCPDPSLAPPKPPEIETTKAPTTVSTVTTEKPANVTRLNFPTSYPGRPKYDREPCLTAKAGTLHPHPDDCKKFIQCMALKRGQELTCATNLVYDPDGKACIFPKNDLICPDILPCLQKKTGYFPHPFNCSLYIQCESGREKIQTCAPGLVWAPTLNSCMFPTEKDSCVDNKVT